MPVSPERMTKGSGMDASSLEGGEIAREMALVTAKASTPDPRNFFDSSAGAVRSTSAAVTRLAKV